MICHWLYTDEEQLSAVYVTGQLRSTPLTMIYCCGLRSTGLVFAGSALLQWFSLCLTGFSTSEHSSGLWIINRFLS